MPRHGFLFSVNMCGNLIGKMTASRRASFALSKPATSLHLTLGFSRKMAPVTELEMFLLESNSRIKTWCVYLDNFI